MPGCWCAGCQGARVLDARMAGCWGAGCHDARMLGYWVPVCQGAGCHGARMPGCWVPVCWGAGCRGAAVLDVSVPGCRWAAGCHGARWQGAGYQGAGVLGCWVTPRHHISCTASSPRARGFAVVPGQTLTPSPRLRRLCLPHLLRPRLGPEGTERPARAEDAAGGK